MTFGTHIQLQLHGIHYHLIDDVKTRLAAKPVNKSADAMSHFSAPPVKVKPIIRPYDNHPQRERDNA